MSPAAPSPESYSEEFYGGPHDLPMLDLALMHQWSIATCYGFGDGFAEDSDPWREHIPIMAQHFPFLMRGILALSALHLAKNTLDRDMRIRYLRTAAYHQDLAIPEYRSTLLDVTKENAAAVMAFSAILTIYSFAEPKDPGRLFAEGPPEWFLLHRGVGDIPSHWQSWINNTFLDRQMHRRRLQPIDPSLNPEDYRLQCLEALIASLPFEEANEAPAYEGALYWLRQAYAHTYNPESMLGGKYALLFWIERVPQGYIDLLSLQRPRAVVLLANAAVLVQRASHFWYLEGLAEHIITEAKQVMGFEFLPWIDWPVQACGMV
ncbi:uncharacterized protein N0V89_005805 [Didymosphaeria variabile]|uniref:C6 zinc finger domain-containing protein n=1 Tax=Didymosphaeria variabile TaxID=1932322 RepID=A0A9W8XLE3_9PLEO|nr:uncharacterized protein N0V89_005805 [Didymosphaeria variabile]KAJ4354072.1 hypothetical protein N0V89_005805 [Didymosphaeria variabile]